MNDPIDVVIPLGTGSEWKDHQEVKYCLRSLEQNLIGLRNVYIVGYLPPWCTNVIHLHAHDPLPKNKDGNIINKVLLACQDDNLSDQFLRISDDQLILKPTTADNLRADHAGDLSKMPHWMNSKWFRRLKRTYQYLLDNNYPTYNYDIHIPFMVDKKKFVEVWNSVDFESDIGYCINTLFFNIIFCNANNKCYIWDEKCTIEKQFYDQGQIYEMLQDKRFLGYGVRGLNDTLKIVIKQLFPNKSKYEL